MDHPAPLTAAFDITDWDETPYDEPARGPRLARATVRKAFTGDLDGESVAELLMCQEDPADESAGAGYVASEVVTGTLAGRRGTFVVQHGGVVGGGDPPRSFGHVVPGSGTGALAGLAGTVTYAADADGHRVTFDLHWPDG